MGGLSGGAARFQAELSRLGATGQVHELPKSATTAREAAAALGCELEQIVKSLVFRDADRDRPVLALVRGIDRVDEAKLAAAVGARVERGTASFVRDRTGYAIGGVPPFGHRDPIRTLVDEAAMPNPRVWAAAGTPSAVFPTTGEELVRLTGGLVAALVAR